MASYSWPNTWYVSAGDGSTLGYYAVDQVDGDRTPTAARSCGRYATPSAGNERVFACVVAGTSGSSEPYVDDH